MKMFIILSVALAGSAAVAQQPSGGGANTSGYDPNEVVCRMVRETGSRLAGKRRCMTRANWEASQRQDRALISDAQLRQVNPQCMSGGERSGALGRYTPYSTRCAQ
jgi:hypothetical protein